MLGSRVRLARRERGWKATDLAERVGVSPTTIRKVEHGDPTVALGTAFEAATLVGVPLFHTERSRRALEAEYVAARLAVLPAAGRRGAADRPRRRGDLSPQPEQLGDAASIGGRAGKRESVQTDAVTRGRKRRSSSRGDALPVRCERRSNFDSSFNAVSVEALPPMPSQ